MATGDEVRHTLPVERGLVSIVNGWRALGYTLRDACCSGDARCWRRTWRFRRSLALELRNEGSLLLRIRVVALGQGTHVGRD